MTGKNQEQNQELYAPATVLAAVEQLEALDARRAEVRDRLQAAKHSIKTARQRDADEGAAAELAGEPLKSSRKHEEEAEASVAELTSRLRAVEAAYAQAREDAYRATAANHEIWLAATAEPDAKAREQLASSLAAAKQALETLAQTEGVRSFLLAFVHDESLSRPQELARQQIARFGRYWPSPGNLSFPNPVRLMHNAKPTPIEILEILELVLEDPRPPAVVGLESRSGFGGSVLND